MRARCLTTIAKVVYFATPEMLTRLLKDVPLSSFLAQLLSSAVRHLCSLLLQSCTETMCVSMEGQIVTIAASKPGAEQS